MIGQIDAQASIASLRGLEGAAAANYFEALSEILPERLHFSGRNRQPPRDPVNALLSLTYTLLHAEAVLALRQLHSDTVLEAARSAGIKIPSLCFLKDVNEIGSCRICVVEVEELVEVGEIDPDAVHLPGIFVHRIVVNANPEKRIEKRTLSEKKGA